MCLLGEERYTVDLHAASDPFFLSPYETFLFPFCRRTVYILVYYVDLWIP